MHRCMEVDDDPLGAGHETVYARCLRNSGETGETRVAPLILHAFLCHTPSSAAVRHVWQPRLSPPFVSPCHTRRLTSVRQVFTNDFKVATHVSPVSPQKGSVVGKWLC